MTWLHSLGPDIWVADGPAAVDLLVVPYPTRMVVCRLDGGELWVASPVAARYAGLEELAQLGPVHHLLAPTPRHHWRLEGWRTLFPEAALWSCRVGVVTVGRRSLPTRRLTDEPPADWAGQIDHARYAGYGFEEITFYHRDSGTLLVEDLLQLHPTHAGVLANALVMIGGIGAGGGVPRDIRLLTRRDQARAWAERVLAWDFDQVVMAHGPVIRTDAKAWVERAFDWLLT